MWEEPRATFERGMNNLNGFKDFRLKTGSGQGQNLHLTVLRVPSSVDSGYLANGEEGPREDFVGKAGSWPWLEQG